MTLSDNCTGIACGGGNSPFTNLFPVNGVSATGDGACNADGIRLLPRSLQGGDCGNGADLTLDETRRKLVGVNHGAPVCSGPSLAGASFAVRRGGKEVQLTITKVQSFTDDGPDQQEHEGYLITNHDQSVCQFDAARGVLRELGMRLKNRSSMPLLVADGYKPGVEDDLVVAMAGPVFDVETAEPIKALEPGHFFNLACADDALAKASFYEISGGPQVSTAALRILTAHYCDMRLTVRGMHIEWESFPKTHENSKLEAKWNADGRALCIEHPRLMELTVKSGDTIVQPRGLPEELQPKGCRSGSAPPGTCEKKDWTTHLVRQCHVSASCDSISKPDEVRFESRVGATPNELFLARAVKPAP